MYHHRNMKLAPVDRRVAFNQAVIKELEKLSPDHAFRLRREGIALGWWNTIDYARTSGKGVDGAVDMIMKD